MTEVDPVEMVTQQLDHVIGPRRGNEDGLGWGLDNRILAAAIVTNLETFVYGRTRTTDELLGQIADLRRELVSVYAALEAARAVDAWVQVHGDAGPVTYLRSEGVFDTLHDELAALGKSPES